MELYEWSKYYITFKDCMKKNIIHRTYQKPQIIVEEKNRTIIYHIFENLLAGLKQLQKTKEVLITLNTKTNFNSLISAWNEIKNHKELTIIFINPKFNQTWLIKPNSHQHITKEENLKKGLQTLYESVREI